jgi:hypothetical protein
VIIENEIAQVHGEVRSQQTKARIVRVLKVGLGYSTATRADQCENGKANTKTDLPKIFNTEESEEEFPSVEEESSELLLVRDGFVLVNDCSPERTENQKKKRTKKKNEKTQT